MGAVTVAEMREIEARAMQGGSSEGELMERAGRALGRAIGREYVEVCSAIGYLGRGHNAGDTLIALRVLREEFGWEVAVRSAYSVGELAELTRQQWDLLGAECLQAEDLKGGFMADTLLLDGLVGIGAKGALREPLAGLAAEMQGFRLERGCRVAAVDLPSGVDPDSGEISDGAVTADRTFMIGEAKCGLLMGGAVACTGALSLVHVEGLSGGGGDMEMICPQRMDFGKAPRPFDFHKGKAGRVGILAGSSAFTGAALIAATGALAAGGGLITLFSPSAASDAIRARLPLEAMFQACDDPAVLLDERFDSIVVGPGLGEMGEEFERGLAELIASTKVPMVVDADALNLIAKLRLKTDERHVLTPHPGEFERLVGSQEGVPREEQVRKFCGNSRSILLLKGSRTIVGKDGLPLRINSTGTPAMANGGQGDLLSGVIGALLGSGMDAFDAAALGAWLCGRAAEISHDEKGSPTKAADVAEKIGVAMRAWRQGQ